MKKIGVVVASLIIVMAMVYFANAELSDSDVADFNEFGEEISSEFQELFSGDELEPAAIILGEEIPEAYYQIRVKLYEDCGSENPQKDAFESLKREINEKQFAEEKGILPTKEEIHAQAIEYREFIESDPETYDILKGLVAGLGVTEEQYWEYYETYEVRVMLTRENVDAYCEEMNQELPVIANKDAKMVSETK